MVFFIIQGAITGAFVTGGAVQVFFMNDSVLGGA
jgi:hypothetical protein